MDSSRNWVASLGFDRLFREIVAAALSNYGWQVLDPESGVLVPGVEGQIVLVSGLGSVKEVIDRLRNARARHPRSKIVVLGAPGLDADLVRFIEEGAIGYVSLNEGISDLVEVLEMLRNDRTSSSGRVIQLVMGEIRRLSEDPHPAPDMCLTLREQEILRLIQDGLCNKEIASRLRIAPNTVKNHVHNLLEKLKVRNRHEAAWLRAKTGLPCVPRVMHPD